MRTKLIVLSFAIFISSIIVPISAADGSPYFVALSTLASSTGADVTITIPTGWEPDDVFLVLGWVRDQNDAVTLSGYTAATGSPFDRGAASRYWVFWKRATTSESNPVFDKSTATGDTFAMMIVYRAAVLTGTPFEVFGAAATGTADPAPCTGLTSLTDESLIVAALGGEDDNNALVTTTSTDPRNYVEHYAESATGTDGMIAFSEMRRAAAGATGTVNVNFDVANPVGWGCMVLALKPQGGGGGGADGFNSLVSVTTASESPGANCANGGTKITFTSGLDNGDGGGTARDGILQAGEVDNTVIYYSCTGATGPAGTDGFNALIDPVPFTPDPACSGYSGVRNYFGLDNGDGGGTARDGILQTGERDGSFVVCTGRRSVTDIVVESPGVNCADGGFRFQSGVDDDGDSLLDPGEVDFTGYACNGADGSSGPQGPAGEDGEPGPRGPPGEGWFLFVIGIAAFLGLVYFLKRDER